MKADNRHILFLQLLKESVPKERKAMLSSVGNDFYKLLTEIIFNLLHGNVPVSKTTIRHLRRYKGSLRTLSDRTVSFARKRTLFCRLADNALFHLLFPIITMVLETYYNEANSEHEEDNAAEDDDEEDNATEDDNEKDNATEDDDEEDNATEDDDDGDVAQNPQVVLALN